MQSVDSRLKISHDTPKTQIKGYVMLDLSVVILNYRTAQLTKNCLDSLKSEIVTLNARVIVVDNCSGDGSADEIERHIFESGYSWAALVQSMRNGGFSAGNNIGINVQPARNYLLLNSDTIVQPGCLQEFLRAAHLNPRAGLIGAGFTDGAGAHIPGCFTFPNPVNELLRAANTGPLTKLLARYALVASHTPVPTSTDWVPFAGVLIRHELVEQIGLLDDQFFMYYEDVDYCLRTRAAGWDILCWPSARITHFVGGSSGIKVSRKRAPRYFYESRTRFFTKHFGYLGYLGANLAWHTGHAIAKARGVFGTQQTVRDLENRDIWINVTDPLAPNQR